MNHTITPLQRAALRAAARNYATPQELAASATLPDYVRLASNRLGTPYVRFIGVGRDAPRWQVGKHVNGDIEWIDVPPPDNEATSTHKRG